MFDATSNIEVSSLLKINPSVSPLQLATDMWIANCLVLSTCQILCRFGVSFQYPFVPMTCPRKTLDFPWFCAMCQVRSQGFPLSLPDFIFKPFQNIWKKPYFSWRFWYFWTNQEPTLPDFRNQQVRFIQTALSANLQKTHVLGRHVWCFIVAWKAGKWIEVFWKTLFATLIGKMVVPLGWYL